MIQRRTDRARAGFTMVEVIISILITSIVVTGIIGLYKITVTASEFSRHSTEASALAEDKLEKLRTLGTAVAQTGTDTNITVQDNPSGMYTRTWTEVLCQDPIPALTVPCPTSASPTFAEVVVTVSWVDDGIGHSVTVYGRRGLL